MYDSNKNLIDRRELLRIKIKTHVAEAQIIRREAAVARLQGKTQLAEEMTNHRKLQLRAAARHAGLALGFIKGRTLEQMEPDYKTNSDAARYIKPIHWKSIREMVVRYGTPLMNEALAEAGTDVTKLAEALNVFNGRRQLEWDRRRRERALKQHTRLSQEIGEPL